MEEFDFAIKDQINKDLLKQLMDQQIDVIPSDEKQKLIDRTGGKKGLGRTAYSMLKMVFELLEGDEITEEEKNTLREVMRKSKEVQIKNIPYQFFEMHKEYLLDENGSNKFDLRSLYGKKQPYRKAGADLGLLKTYLQDYCKGHTYQAYKDLKHKPKFYTATESRSASGRSYPFFEFKDNKSNTMNKLSPTNMKVIQRVLQVIPSVNPILINWQSRLFTVMHLTMIALDRKDRTLKGVLLHFLKNYGLDENGHLPIELLKEAQSKVTKTVYMKVGKKGMDDYIGLDYLFDSFNDPEKFGTGSMAPIDAVAQNWVIFMANVVRNPKFFKGYPIPTDTKTRFYDVKGEDPNTYHAGKFANAILETIKDYIYKFKPYAHREYDRDYIEFRYFSDGLIIRLLAKFSSDKSIRDKYQNILKESEPKRRIYGEENTSTLRQFTEIVWDQSFLKQQGNLFEFSNLEFDYKFSTLVNITEEEVATLLDNPNLKFNRNFAKYTLMLAGYGGSFRNALGKGLRETEQALYKYNEELDEFVFNDEEWETVLIFANILRLVAERKKDLEYVIHDKVVKNLGAYRQFWDTLLNPKIQNKYTEEFIKGAKMYHWYPLPDVLRVSRQKVITYNNNKKSKAQSVLMADLHVNYTNAHSYDRTLATPENPHDIGWGEVFTDRDSFLEVLGMYWNVTRDEFYAENYAYIYKTAYLENTSWKNRNMDKAPISLFIHGLDSTLKDKVKEYFLLAEQGEILTNHDSYSPHSQFAFDFMDIYVQTFKDIMVQEDLLKRFAEAYNLTSVEIISNSDWIKLQKSRASQEEIKKIIDIPNEYWLHMIWNV